MIYQIGSVGGIIARYCRYRLVLAVICSCAAAAKADEVNCTFNLEMTKKGAYKLADHQYRVRQIGAVEVLEQHTADGSWMFHANVTYQVASGLGVYMHLPDAREDDYFASVIVLTVYRDGRANLFQVHPQGRNYGDAWTTYGECRPAPAG